MSGAGLLVGLPCLQHLRLQTTQHPQADDQSPCFTFTPHMASTAILKDGIPGAVRREYCKASGGGGERLPACLVSCRVCWQGCRCSATLCAGT